MSISLQFKLTQAGQTAAFNATNTGLSLNLTHVQVGSGNKTPTGLETALVTPVASVGIAAGFSVSPSQIRMTAVFSGAESFAVREVGLWSGVPGAAGSVLVCYWSQAAGDLVFKASGVDFVFSHDMVIDAAVASGSLTVVADPTQAAVLAMVAMHEQSPDPHPQYATDAALATALTQAAQGLFRKANPATVAWTKTGNGTAATATALHIEVNGVVQSIASGTSIVMPALTIGTDYNIWCRPDGSLEANIFMLTAPVAGARRVGGFHYSPGGNAAAQSGGNTTPQINEFSFWDLKWRPACADPRGMTLVAGAFWSDIYLLGVDHQISGSSRFAAPVADGSSPPKCPLSFGGNGYATYRSFNWWEAAEVAKSFGKRLPAYDEFAALAYGTTENSSIGTDPGSTSWAAAYVSKWGVNQATGVLWIWGAEFGYLQDVSATQWAWRNSTENRGQLFLYGATLAAPIFGGSWGDTVSSGSRASSWSITPWNSSSGISARLVCDHLSLD